MDTWQWIWAFVAALMVGVAKTGISGLGILAVALYTSVLPPSQSIGTVLLNLITGDVIAVATYRHHAQWKHLWKVFPWAGLGITLGALILGRVNHANIPKIIGGILVVLVCLYYLRQWFLSRNRNGATNDIELLAIERYPWLTPLAGITAGAATMLANASGPIMVLYLLSLRLPKHEFIGTAAWYFLIFNLFKVPYSYALGYINPVSITTSLWFVPFTFMGALFGRWLLTRIDQPLFEQLALVLTLVAGVRLLF